MLKPLPSADIDPQINVHLEPGEMVLWQNQPRKGSFFGPSAVATAIALIVLAVIIASGVIGQGLPAASRYVPAAALVFVALVMLGSRWRARAELWRYAITDRRLMSVLRDRLIRSVPPEMLDRLTLSISGDTVYWIRFYNKRSRDLQTGEHRGPDGQLVGFHGQADPSATRALIEEWRLGFSQRATVQAEHFVDQKEAAEEAFSDPSPAPKGIRRIRHQPSGLEIDLPEGWPVTVSQQTDGPLKILGVTILPRILRETSKRPYDGSGTWNKLSVQAAPEAGLDLTLSEQPLRLSLDDVLNDPWIKVTGTNILRSDPDLRVGPLRGFGVIRTLPAGVQVKNVEALSAPAMQRQLWLGNDRISVEILANALEGQADIQEAMEAIIASIDVRH